MNPLAAKQLFAVFGALSFLATLACLLAAAAVIAGSFLVGESRLSKAGSAVLSWLFSGRGLRAKVSAAAVVLVAGYALVLLGVSLASSETTLQPGAEKYFCEVDCHLAYSVTNVVTQPEVNGVRAQGVFYVITLRTRFDETTISKNRGNGPLEPSPRALYLVDSAGNRYTALAAAQTALESSGAAGTPIRTPLRPGESFTSTFAFDLPANARDLRLDVDSPSNPAWISSIIIGDEDSLLHKKTYLALAAPRTP